MKRRGIDTTAAYLYHYQLDAHSEMTISYESYEAEISDHDQIQQGLFFRLRCIARRLYPEFYICSSNLIAYPFIARVKKCSRLQEEETVSHSISFPYLKADSAKTAL